MNFYGSAVNDGDADRTALNTSVSDRVGLYGRILPKKMSSLKQPVERSLMSLEASSENVKK